MHFSDTTATLERMPNGVDGVKYTLARMRSLVRDGKKNINLRLKALSLVKRHRQKEWVNEVKSLHRYVRDRIRYVKDIRGIETLQTPIKTLELGQGDCDDKSTLLATLLETIGHPTRFIAMSRIRDQFCHVYVETRIGNKWIPLETTENVNVGWNPKATQKIRVHN